VLNLAELTSLERALLLASLVVIVAVLTAALETRLHAWVTGDRVLIDCPFCGPRYVHQPGPGSTAACTSCGTVRLLPRHSGGGL